MHMYNRERDLSTWLRPGFGSMPWRVWQSPLTPACPPWNYDDDDYYYYYHCYYYIYMHTYIYIYIYMYICICPALLVVRLHGVLPEPRPVRMLPLSGRGNYPKALATCRNVGRPIVYTTTTRRGWCTEAFVSIMVQSQSQKSLSGGGV